jgi:hypothetical protein
MRNNNTTNPDFSERAVSVYGNGDAMDDFPVLKAFQQYIDAEQAKARKRLLAMGAFFGVLMLAVVTIFVFLLISASNRNQQLNDRLVEFAMRERNTGSAVVVQSPQDSATVLALTAKLDEMNRKIAEAQTKSDKAIADAEAKVQQAATKLAAAIPKQPTADELEIQRLKAQLAAEKEKAAAEKARQREIELEAYRRKHYPELYEPHRSLAPAKAQTPMTTQDAPTQGRNDAIDRNREREISQLLQDIDDLSSLDVGSRDTSVESTLTPTNYFDHAVPLKDGETSLDWGVPD